MKRCLIISSSSNSYPTVTQIMRTQILSQQCKSDKLKIADNPTINNDKGQPFKVTDIKHQ